MFCEPVLIVGDRPAVVLRIQSILQSFGLGTRIAASGEEAVALCSQQQFSHSFITETLSDTDGVSLFTRIKSVQSGVEGVLVSAIANLNTVWKAVGAGMRRVVAEPVDLMEVVLAMESSEAETSSASPDSSLVVDDARSIASLTSEEIRFELTNSDLIRMIRSVDYPFAGKDRLESFDRDALERLAHLVRQWCQERVSESKWATLP
ncbi:MAG: response regulator [Planctomycetaceae bacterium]